MIDGIAFETNILTRNAAIVRQLDTQIREIRDQQSHRKNDGEPQYRLVQRIALLSHEIRDDGGVQCYNCKNGKPKDRIADSGLFQKNPEMSGMVKS